MRKRNKRRGAVLVELAIITPLAIALLLGGIHFGYLFYLYNLVDKSVRDGARYAASRTYTNAASYNAVIQNVVVYGGVGLTTTPVAQGLTTGMVTVTEIFPAAGGRPERIKVAVNGYTYTGVLSSVLGTVTLTGKPSMEVPFIGLYMPQ